MRCCGCASRLLAEITPTSGFSPPKLDKVGINRHCNTFRSPKTSETHKMARMFKLFQGERELVLMQISVRKGRCPHFASINTYDVLSFELLEKYTITVRIFQLFQPHRGENDTSSRSP